jgi:hypothetical protein
VTGSDGQNNWLQQHDGRRRDDVKMLVDNVIIVVGRRIGCLDLHQMVNHQNLVLFMIAVDTIMCVDRKCRKTHQQKNRSEQTCPYPTKWSNCPIGEKGAKASHDLRSMPKVLAYLKGRVGTSWNPPAEQRSASTPSSYP